MLPVANNISKNTINSLFFFPIILQYCSGFCHTLTWISHGFTCVPHPEPPSHLAPHPIPLGQPSAPAPTLGSCIQPGLAICFKLDNTLVSKLFSHKKLYTQRGFSHCPKYWHKWLVKKLKFFLSMIEIKRLTYHSCTWKGFLKLFNFAHLLFDCSL